MLLGSNSNNGELKVEDLVEIITIGEEWEIIEIMLYWNR